MTESDWLDSIDPNGLLDFVSRTATDRKLRLFGCAWASDIWPRMTDERSRTAVWVTERFADGLADQSELERAHSAARAAFEHATRAVFQQGRKPRKIQLARGGEAEAAELARDLSASGWGGRVTVRGLPHLTGAQKYALANHLRDIFGNPFRRPRLLPGWLASAVTGLAATIYEDRAFDCMPILADALEDAGCDDADVLAHCRGPGPHVRGCWLVDLILGKS